MVLVCTAYRYMELLGHIQPLYSLCFPSPGPNLCCSLISRTVRWQRLYCKVCDQRFHLPSKLQWQTSLLNCRDLFWAAGSLRQLGSKYFYTRGTLGCKSETQLPRLSQRLQMPWCAASTTRAIRYSTPCNHALCPLEEVYCNVLYSISSCKSSQSAIRKFD